MKRASSRSIWYSLLTFRLLAVSASFSGPRVAILFFGLTRSLPYTVDSIRSAVYDPLVINDIRFDVFLHTYNVTQVSNPRSLESNVEVDWKLYKLLLPKSSEVEDADSVFDINFSRNLSGYLQHGDAWDEDHHTSLRNMLLQLHSLRKVYRLAQEASDRSPYDAFIATRSDLWFFTTLNISHVLEASRASSKLFTPDFDLYSGLNDRFAIGGNKAMRVYCNRIEDAAKYAAIANLHAERFLKNTLEISKLDLRRTDIIFERVRSHGYMQGLPEYMDGPGKRLREPPHAWRPGQWLHKNNMAMWELSPEQIA